MEKGRSPNSNPIQVLIAHEVRILREGLTSLLSQQPEVTVITPALHGTNHKARQGGSADVVLLDASNRMDAEALADQIENLSRAWPNGKVIVLGVAETPSGILSCIEAGASGYTLPSHSVEDLIDTITMVHKGQASCPPDMLAHLFERITSLSKQVQSIQTELSNLTQRELEVLQLIADGKSNKEISVHLNLELQTVKNYVHSVLQKLQVRNRREAAAYTLKRPIAQAAS